MPITAFSNFTDGLEPNRRSREHFITNTNLDDDRLWVPYANGVWFQPCCFNVTSGGFTVVLKGLPGSMVGTHYHVGTVHGYTMRGHWRYLEHDWIAKPGTYIYEPAGEAHTLVITEDSPEPMITLFVVGGGLVYLDKAVNGQFGTCPHDNAHLSDRCQQPQRESKRRTGQSPELEYPPARAVFRPARVAPLSFPYHRHSRFEWTLVVFNE